MNTDKKSTFNIKHSTFGHQDGVTIVVAIILLATIAFISFSLSTIVLRGIRTSQVLQDTELALAGANAGGEVGTFRFQRNAGGLNLSDVTLPSNNGTTFSVVPDLTDPQYNFSISSPNTVYINLYNADDINSQDPGFRSITVTNSSGNNIQADVYNWADVQSPVPGCTYILIAGQSQTCNVNAGRYQVGVQISGSGSATGNVRGSSDINGGGAIISIPSESPVLEIIGKKYQVQRRIHIDL